MIWQHSFVSFRGGADSIPGIKISDFNANYVFTRKKTETSDSEYKKKLLYRRNKILQQENFKMSHMDSII